MKPRPRKPGLDPGLWDQRPSGESREWNADKSARAAMCASPHLKRCGRCYPDLPAFRFPSSLKLRRASPPKASKKIKGSPSYAKASEGEVLALRVMGEISEPSVRAPAKSVAREREGFASMSRLVIARSASDEAIQGPLAHALDCFAALAMTSGKCRGRRPSRAALPAATSG